MKIVVTGATGFVGREVVAECIRNPAISAVVALTRRPIQEDLAADPKVTTIIHQNFEEYPDDVLAQFDGAQGCIWALGGKVGAFPDTLTARKVGVDYTVSAAKAFATRFNERSAEQGTVRKFIFAYCGARFAEWNAEKKLWLANDNRKLKGEVEQKLIGIADQHERTFAVTLLRPGGILEEQQRKYQGIINRLIAVVSVKQLAIALIEVCQNPVVGAQRYLILENEEISRLGDGEENI